MLLVKEPLFTEGRIAENDIELRGNIDVLIAAKDVIRFGIEVAGNLRRNGIALNSFEVRIPFFRTQADKIAYACGGLQYSEGGCVFANAKTSQAAVDTANDGFRGVMGILCGASRLCVLVVGKQRLDFVVLFPPLLILSIKCLRQPPPADIAYQYLFFFRACDFRIFFQQLLEDADCPDIVFKLDGGASNTKFIRRRYAVISSLVSTPSCSRISQSDMPLMLI